MSYSIESTGVSLLIGDDDFTTMLLKHRDELATHPELMQVNPNLEVYDAMQDAGKLMALAVYDDRTARLVGYSVNFIDKSLHYGDLIVAQNDVLYIEPEHRGAIGLRLISRTEQLAAALGAQLMLWHAKEGTVLHKVLARKGYTPQDVIYSKPL